MKKVLVTGSTGFIGSHLVDELIKRGFKVRCLVRNGSNLSVIEGKSVEIAMGSYSDIESLENAVKDVEVVFHLGAIINGSDWKTFYEVNTLGTENLFKAYSKAGNKKKKFIFISSIAASGPASRNNLKNESDGDTPVSLYGKSKLLAEGVVKR